MRSSLSLIFILLLTCGMAAAQTPSTAKPADKAASSTGANLPSEATVDSFMQQTFGYEPQVSWKISSIKPAAVPGLAEVDVVLASPQGQQFSRFYITSDGEHALVGEIIPFGAKPFDTAKKTLEKGITGPSRGPKDAPVTVVEFGDLQCPACKAAQPAIEALIASEPNARFVFQNVAHASNDAFWKFIAKTYETQADITAENADEKLTALADAAGVKGADIATCAGTPVAKAHVDASLALGKAVNVSGTPTLFINGRSIGNVSQIPAANLKGLVDFAAKEGK